MANQAVAFDHDAKQQRIVVAIGRGRNDAQPIAAGLALHPKLLAGAAPEGYKAALQRLGIADRIEKTQHQHFAGARILHDSGHEAIHFVEVNCRGGVAHSSSSFLNLNSDHQQKARRLDSPAGLFDLISLAVYFRPWQSAGMEVP